MTTVREAADMLMPGVTAVLEGPNVNRYQGDIGTQKEIIERLKARGVTLYVGSCGCCASPWIETSLDGVLVYKSDGENLGEETE